MPTAAVPPDAAAPAARALGDAHRIVLIRGLRGFVDGFVSVLLAGYLSRLGFTPVRIGAIVTGTLLGSAALTMALGLGGHRMERRPVLVGASLVMLATGIGFAGLTAFWPLLVVAVLGTLNPSAGDVSVFLPTEQAALAQTTPAGERTRLFAWYNVAGNFAGAGATHRPRAHDGLHARSGQRLPHPGGIGPERAARRHLPPPPRGGVADGRARASGVRHGRRAAGGTCRCRERHERTTEPRRGRSAAHHGRDAEPFGVRLVSRLRRHPEARLRPAPPGAVQERPSCGGGLMAAELVVSMAMPVVNVRDVRVSVFCGNVPMKMSVGFENGLRVLVLMMLVVEVRVLVLERLVYVPMAVRLGHEEEDAEHHEARGYRMGRTQALT